MRQYTGADKVVVFQAVWIISLLVLSLGLNVKLKYELKDISQDLRKTTSDVQVLESKLHKAVQENQQQKQELEKLRNATDSSERLLRENYELRKSISTMSSRGSARPRNMGTAAVLPLDKYKFKKDLGVWKISYYTPSKDECGKDNGMTASGEYIIPGYSAAISGSKYKLGTLFYIEGWGIVKAMDHGGAINGAHRADLALFSKDIAFGLGIDKRRVWEVEEIK